MASLLASGGLVTYCGEAPTVHRPPKPGAAGSPSPGGLAESVRVRTLQNWRRLCSLPGAVLGGLLIGLIETFFSGYFSLAYKDVAAFSVLAITLIFMPQGILGRPEVEKV